MRNLQSDYDAFANFIERMIEHHPDNKNFLTLYEELIKARMTYEEKLDAAEIGLRTKLDEFDAKARRERLKRRLELRLEPRADSGV